MSLGLSRYLRWQFATAKKELTASAASVSNSEGAPWQGSWFSFLERDAELNGWQLSKTILWTASIVGPRWNTHGGSHMSVCDLPGGSGTVEVENLQQPGLWWRMSFLDHQGNELARITPSKSCERFLKVSIELPPAPVFAPPAPVSDDEDEDSEDDELEKNPSTASGEKAAEGDGASELGKVVEGKDSAEKCVQNPAEKLTIWVYHYFYEDCTAGPLPAVRLGGRELVARGSCDLSRLAYMDTLRQRQGLNILAQHWYVFFMLSCKRFLPASFVDQDMLAKRDSTVAIMHGVAIEGLALNLEASKAFLDEHLVFCTVYSRGSMPIIGGFRMRGTFEVLHPCREDGFWQLRIVRRDAGNVTQDVGKEVKVQLQRLSEKAKQKLALEREPKQHGWESAVKAPADKKAAAEGVSDKKNE